MTAKEKAFHLHFSFIRDVIANDDKAKICALKVVDEIYNSGLLVFVDDEQYWHEVKQEIEKL
jgi:hypothetical protein